MISSLSKVNPKDTLLTIPRARRALGWADGYAESWPTRSSSWRYAEEFVVEPAAIAVARQHSLELGIEAVTPAMGAQLALLAAASSASSILEIGTGAGVSGLWLMRGAPHAVLISIDLEFDHQQVARQSFADAGVPADRVRLIPGTATRGAAAHERRRIRPGVRRRRPGSLLDYVEHGLRIARRGGIVVVAHALWRGRVADPARATNGRRLPRAAHHDRRIVRRAASLSTAGDGCCRSSKPATSSDLSPESEAY